MESAPSLFPEFLRDTATDHSTGILPAQVLRELTRTRSISADVPFEPNQVQPASLDLRLGSKGFRVAASFLPGKKGTIVSRLQEMLADGEAEAVDLSRGFTLRRGHVYVIQLLESLRLGSELAGRSNPKSTTGRLDVFTRLLIDYATEFDRVPPGYRGPLYVEVIPHTFDIRVRVGSKLNQLRVIRGTPQSSDARLAAVDERSGLVYTPDGRPGLALIEKGLWLSVELGSSPGPIGFKAKRRRGVIDVDRKAHYRTSEYWEPLFAGSRSRLVLEPGAFYILASKERVRIPPDFAAEMVAYEPTFGEFRVHYAGFFDPGFGYGEGEVSGARAVLEVRSHGIPSTLEDGQVIGRLVFERLMARAEKIYGPEIGSVYQAQGLALSKQFK